VSTEGQESNLYREEEQHAKEVMRGISTTNPGMAQERDRVKRQREEQDRAQQTRVLKLEHLLQRQYGDQFAIGK